MSPHPPHPFTGHPAVWCVVLSTQLLTADDDAGNGRTPCRWSCTPLQLRTMELVNGPERAADPSRTGAHPFQPPPVDRQRTAEPEEPVLPPREPFALELHRQQRLIAALEKPTAESEGLYQRIILDAFEPVGMQVGKTTVSCSILTAIERKNPLCLLNPLVLNVSW